MDSNYGADETYGTVEFDVTNLPLDEPLRKTFLFNEVGYFINKSSTKKH